MTVSLTEEAPIAEKIIEWKNIGIYSDEIRSRLTTHGGRLSVLIHTGGGYLGRYENGKYHSSYSGTLGYLDNIRKSIADETSVILFLGAYFKTINDVRTRAICIDLPSASDIPIPDLGQAITWGDFSSWKTVIADLQAHGANSISPFGGETAILEKGKVVGGCVNGALEQLRGHFPVNVHPQLCGDEHGNTHIKINEPLSLNSYEA